MSVFLRWGIFGILGVAALVYAYNASKRMAEAHERKAAQVASAPATPAAEAAEPVPAAAPEASAAAAPAVPPIPALCEAELVVARRALDARRQGDPLDRLLRIQEIAWQEPPERRKRLELVATRYYGYTGDFTPAALRIAVISDCQRATPAP